VRDKFEYNADGVGISATNQSRFGWTVGAGIEYAFTPNWSIAAQYNFIDLRDRDVTFAGSVAPFPFGARADQELHLATVRLNYRFGGYGWPVAARY
jgi:outer membrane immunogenic protein